MSPKRHILFVGGGTAGHIAPLLAVMESVQQQAAERGIELTCSYIGSQQDLASPLIANSHLPFARHEITIGKLNRFLTWKHFREMTNVVKGWRQAPGLVAKLKPDVVFLKGGPTTVVVALAAAKQGIPIICHETDVAPGLSNQFVARYAQIICTSFPTSAYITLPKNKLRETGQPIRAIFYDKKLREAPLLLQDRNVEDQVPLLVVTGGSQGGHALNMLVSTVWPELLDTFQIIQQCGERDYASLQATAQLLSAEQQQRLWLQPFIREEQAHVFYKSRVVVSRAGGTIAELAAVRAVAVLVPLSTAAQDHQTANGQVLAAAGAAVVVDETKVTSQEFLKIVQRVAHSAAERERLQTAIGQFDHPHAAQSIAKLLLFP